MDKNSAARLIQEVFQNSFNRDRFVTFTKNLFNFLDTEKNFIYRGNFIPDAYKPYINTFERIGKYEDAEDNKIDVLIVHLKKEHSIEYARTMQRNFIAWYLGGSRGGELKDAALVAFYTDNPDDWRFSLVKMDYQIVESSTGKIKTKTELTPARRFSFLVGKNENSHTAQKQLLPILQDDKNNPLLSDLEKAFNIEVVTQEFFEKYKSLFLDVKDSLERIIQKDPTIAKDFAEKSVDPVDFSKKLLGQIVFLYFLQKKGWFGVERDSNWGTGPKNFLRLLFEKMISNYENFFNDILEPLFYEALAKERDKDFYSRFNCKIPFLNGGLFDPISDYDWVHTDILLPNDLFSNHVKTKEGDLGTGILDIFDRYNFTVKEDEPLEKEVAVDPEMLGKVFEYLLEVKDRKSKGTYYTPREIVHYMCQESLINYLVSECEEKVNREDIETLIQYGESAVEHDSRVEQEGKETETYSYKLPESIRNNAQLIDDKLKNIRVCDPAIGSGAFPVGMMSEIIRTRNTLTSYLDNKEGRSIYNFKRDAIQNSLYGVDIDPGAVEIAKLRLWLSLVVDEEDIKQIKPLPNLDYKIMQGNSLLEEFEGVRLFDEELISKPAIDDDKYRDGIKELMTRLQREYIQLHSTGKLTNARKSELDLELKKQAELLKHLSKQEKTRSESTGLFDMFSEAKKKAQELKQLHKEFFEASQKTKKDELKKRIEKLEWELIETTLKEQNRISALKQLEQYKKSNIKPFFLWKLNFPEVFQEKGGFDVVIANPPYVKEYVNRSAFDGLRNSPYYQGKMDLWYLFASKGIDLVKSNSGTVTFIAQNNWVTSYGATKIRNKIIKDTQILSLIDFGNFKIFKTAGIQTMVMVFKKDVLLETYSFDYRRLQGNDLVLDDILALLNKSSNSNAEYLNPQISRTSFIDKKFTFSNSGVESILEKLISKVNFHLDPIKEVAQGMVCPQDNVIKSSLEVLGRHFKIGDGIFVLSDKEVKEIGFSEKELGLIKPFYTTIELQKWYGNSENKKWVIYTDSSFRDKNKIEYYPNIKTHLDQFKKVITSDNKPYGLHRARDEHFFIGEKVIAVRKCTEPTFTYTDFDAYVSATFYVIKTERISQKYLVGLLNSSLITFWLRHKGKMQGNNYQIDKEPIIDIPILEPSQSEQKEIINTVDQIIKIIKTDNKDSKSYELEKKIDQLVYKLYDLTPEEIVIVEGKNENN